MRAGHPRRPLAAAALFVSLSGTAYAAATIGSPDVIDNSLQSIDLRDGAAVRSVDVVNETLIGADINESALKGVARKIVWNSAAAVNPPRIAIATIGPYTFKADCRSGGAGQSVDLGLYVRGPAGDFQAAWVITRTDTWDADLQDTDSSGAFIPAATDVKMANAHSLDETYRRSAGTAWIHSGPTLIRLDFHLLADMRTSPGSCQLYATATEAV